MNQLARVVHRCVIIWNPSVFRTFVVSSKNSCCTHAPVYSHSLCLEDGSVSMCQRWILSLRLLCHPQENHNESILHYNPASAAGLSPLAALLLLYTLWLWSDVAFGVKPHYIWLTVRDAPIIDADVMLLRGWHAALVMPLIIKRCSAAFPVASKLLAYRRVVVCKWQKHVVELIVA